jgi:hypothetical protein
MDILWRIRPKVRTQMRSETIPNLDNMTVKTILEPDTQVLVIALTPEPVGSPTRTTARLLKTTTLKALANHLPEIKTNTLLLHGQADRMTTLLSEALTDQRQCVKSIPSCKRASIAHQITTHTPPSIAPNATNQGTTSLNALAITPTA